MFKKAKRLNKILSSLFMVALFGFFACTMHIFPTSHDATKNYNVGHHNEGDQKEAKCVDHDTTLSFHNKDHHFVVDQLVINNSFNYFEEITSLLKVDNITFEGPPPKQKVPIFIKNNIFLI